MLLINTKEFGRILIKEKESYPDIKVFNFEVKKIGFTISATYYFSGKDINNSKLNLSVCLDNGSWLCLNLGRLKLSDSVFDLTLSSKKAEMLGLSNKERLDIVKFCKNPKIFKYVLAKTMSESD